MMKTVRKLLTVVAICVAGFLAAAPNAGATTDGATDGGVTAKSDGALHLYRGYNRTDQCGSFVAEEPNLGDACFWREASLWNNRTCANNTPDVWVYADAMVTGETSRRGVYCGVAINDLHPFTFDIGTGDYGGYSLFHHIGGFEWTRLPR
jgi:hypothetical protein